MDQSESDAALNKKAREAALLPRLFQTYYERHCCSNELTCRSRCSFASSEM